MMTKSTTASLMATMVALKRADSLMPRMWSAVTAATIAIAGRSNAAPVAAMRPVCGLSPNGESPTTAGQEPPNTLMRSWK